MLYDPVSTLKRACSFLEIPCQNNLLRADLGGLSSFKENRQKGIDLKRRYKYKEVLTGEQIKLIENLAEKELKKYGYLSQKAKPSHFFSLNKQRIIYLQNNIFRLEEIIKNMTNVKEIKYCRW